MGACRSLPKGPIRAHWAHIGPYGPKSDPYQNVDKVGIMELQSMLLKKENVLVILCGN